MKYNIKTLTYVIPIVIIAPVYNIPRFFELATGFDCGDTIYDNDKLNKQGDLEVEVTNIKQNLSFGELCL